MSEARMIPTDRNIDLLRIAAGQRPQRPRKKIGVGLDALQVAGLVVWTGSAWRLTDAGAEQLAQLGGGR